MKKCWLVLTLAAILATGCITKNPDRIYYTGGKPKSPEVQKADEEYARQKQEKKRQEQEAENAEDIRDNPWKTYTVEQIKQLAKENQIAIVLLQLQQGRVVGAMGVDLTSIQRGINLYGLPITKGGVTYGPTRKDAAYSRFDVSQYGAICKTGALIVPNNRVVSIKEIMPYAKENPEWAIWQVLCSNGSVVPEPTIMQMKDHKN